jgi:DNA-directed RNA polymerase specialized sigma subunit
VVDAEERLNQVVRHISEALDVRLALIEQLSDERQKTLLTLRYINGMGWEDIGYAMHYERTQVFEIHTQALQAVQKALGAPGNGNRLQTGGI